jgi:hypothetical protein
VAGWAEYRSVLSGVVEYQSSVGSWMKLSVQSPPGQLEVPHDRLVSHASAFMYFHSLITRNVVIAPVTLETIAIPISFAISYQRGTEGGGPAARQRWRRIPTNTFHHSYLRIEQKVHFFVMHIFTEFIMHNLKLRMILSISPSAAPL